MISSAHQDDETVALVGHRTHIVSQLRKMTANLLAQIPLVIGALPLRLGVIPIEDIISIE